MLAYRDAPLNNGKTPAELLLGRKLRTRLPSTANRRETLQTSLPRRSDKGKPLPELHPNATERVKANNRRQGKWPDRASVVGSSGPRSYDVELVDERMTCRNRQHLLLTRESYRPIMYETGETTQESPTPVEIGNEESIPSPPVLRKPSSPVLRKPSSPVLRKPSSPELHASATSESCVRRYPERNRKPPKRLDL